MSNEPLRCAGALIVDDHGRIFIQRRTPDRRLFPNCWDIVGGHLEVGEDYEDALRREVPEETGWQVSHVLVDLGELRYADEQGVIRIERDYLIRVDGELNAPRQDPAEHTEWRWITRAEIDLVDEDRGIGDKLTRQLVAAGFAALATLENDERNDDALSE